jgi:hypothetical protein
LRWSLKNGKTYVFLWLLGRAEAAAEFVTLFIRTLSRMTVTSGN